MKQKLDKIIILINILILLLLCCNNNNIVYAESPGAFSSALHDENHPETQIIEGEVIDTGAVNSNGDKSLEKVEQEDPINKRNCAKKNKKNLRNGWNKLMVMQQIVQLRKQNVKRQKKH